MWKRDHERPQAREQEEGASSRETIGRTTWLQAPRTLEGLEWIAHTCHTPVPTLESQIPFSSSRASARRTNDEHTQADHDEHTRFALSKNTSEYYSEKNTVQLVSRLETDRRGQLRRPLRAPVTCEVSCVCCTFYHQISGQFVRESAPRRCVLFDVSVSYRNRGKRCNPLQR